ncbi:adenylosuccinate lyase [Thermoflexus sp.]|uniref:adenylosuccinate lyase n=1 Tax=Thermoflexus sp. TaxID=1969742 RepID=UPI0025F44DFF|nr:adenylosuccinate lyase [Thermoflexus sp.]MCS6963097.1 adenylosuccinate lyase [Thermoflexus sp.]MCX7689763.1 adenylosuccinate lyase [Thermoflexus sp.]MDW8184087.1 adenylosuccinate lyase [Anaerolineae bacterium]
MFTHETFLSPFTWRYGSPAMRRIWSEAHRRRLWRRVWVALARAQMAAGLVRPEQLADLEAHVETIDLERAEQIEREIGHDLMAELLTFAEQAPQGGPALHLGATSADIEDNADAIRIRDALDLIRDRLREVLEALAEAIERWAATPCMAWTHLQPAEPTTVGYRLALYGQDLLRDWEEISRCRAAIRGKGFKGAVGTGASYAALLEGTSVTPSEMEERAMAALDLAAFPVAGQIYPRKQDWQALVALAGLAMSLYKMAFDLRLLQAPPFGEWSEPFGARQVGSSAMPFKRNPVLAERINALARYLGALPSIIWETAAHSLLERTLDDSAIRRILLPEAFLAADEILQLTLRILRGIEIREEALRRNLERYAPFAALEPILMAAARAGADRQALHARLRDHAMAAWEAVRSGAPNPLPERLAADPEITRWLAPETLRRLMEVHLHIGDAPQRARAMAQEIRRAIASDGASK